MTSDTYPELVEARLKSFLNERKAAALTDGQSEMLSRIETLVLRAGKRSRPRLLELTYRGYGGEDSAMLVDIGVALELQHQFLLVHDDIMDNDTVRYDGPNLLGMYRDDYPAEDSTIAYSMALMAGNLLFSFACQIILDHPTLSADKKVSVLALIQETNVGVHAGQQLDIVNLAALDPKIDADTLLQTDYLKTALYTVRLPMQVAAELLDLPPEERVHIDDFAKAFGTLYQLVDDYADYFQSGTAFDNHPKYRDFRQGKITYPLLVALQNASPEDQAYLRQHLGDKNSNPETMKKVLSIFDTSGAREAAAQQIAKYYAQSFSRINILKLTENSINEILRKVKTKF